MRRILCVLGLAAALLAGGGPALLGAQTMPGLAPGQLTDDQLRIVLQARGYSDLTGFAREGDDVRVAEARRYGEPVGPLALDAKTGQVRDEAGLNEAQVRAMLRSRGFSEVTEVGREGDEIRARGTRGESLVELRIDPRTGTVTQQHASRR